MRQRQLHVLLWTGLIGCAIIPAAVARAAAGPECVTRVTVTDRSSIWSSPLDRIVSVDIPDSPIREALDRVAAAAKLEFSYSSELLPADRRTCLTLDRAPVGAVLETLLAGTSLRAIVIGSSQIVLAPIRLPAHGTTTSEMRGASLLDRVVVTGTPDGAPQRGSPFALEVIEGATLSRHRATTLGDALDLAVPGIWVWSASAGSLTARYGSVRGASSFGASAPKIYLDGIEVANPLLVTQIDPSRVERIEVIRGPQGAALYGADAISGVVNILTRHDGSATGGTTLQVSSVAGMAATDYAPRNAFVQEHHLAVRGGSGARTFGVGLNLGTVGEYVPGASERRLLADGDGRLVFDNAVLTGTGRFSLQRANASSALVFGGVAPAFTQTARANVVSATASGFGDASGMASTSSDSALAKGDSIAGQEIVQYTLGATATMMPSVRWTHTLIAGVDGYRLDGLSTAGLPMTSSYSGALAQGRGGADRTTLRARAVGRYDIDRRTLLAVTLAAEQAFTREILDLERQAPTVRVGNAGYGAAASALSRAFASTTDSRWGNSGGLSAQANLSWNDAMYLIAGVRAERSTGFTAHAQHAVLPMLGAAYVRDVNGWVLKLRTAYGRGIRPATSITHGATWIGNVLAARSGTLQPESQAGTEIGFDLLAGRALTLRVTRFDQRASGLVQPVAELTSVVTAPGRLERRMNYALENVGAIANQGWELQASTSLQGLVLAGSFTLVDSRVDQVANAYRGDLRVGDRMLDVPARTYGLSATYAMSRWSASTMITRAEDWVGYDRARISRALAATDRTQLLNGRQLRNFWVTYGGITRVRANVSYRVTNDWSVLAGGENLLNVQRGAPDNATVTAGRTLTFGLRAGY